MWLGGALPEGKGEEVLARLPVPLAHREARDESEERGEPLVECVELEVAEGRGEPLVECVKLLVGV